MPGRPPPDALGAPPRDPGPRRSSPRSESSGATERVGQSERGWAIFTPAAIQALAGIFVYSMAETALWNFGYYLPVEAGVPEELVGAILSSTVLMGLAGGALAAWLGTSRGRLMPIVVGSLVSVAGRWLFIHSSTAEMVFLAGLLWGLGFYFVISLPGRSARQARSDGTPGSRRRRSDQLRLRAGARCRGSRAAVLRPDGVPLRRRRWNGALPGAAGSARSPARAARGTRAQAESRYLQPAIRRLSMKCSRRSSAASPRILQITDRQSSSVSPGWWGISMNTS